MPASETPQANFSLLLPVYAGDNAEHLRLAFESSVDQQTLRPAEAVIVQDGPVPDALAAELERIEASSSVPVRVIRLSENRGLTEALNAGLDACSHPVVARMDADDVSSPERFARQWELIEQGYDLVGTGMQEFEHDPATPSAIRVPPVGAERIRDHARTHNPSTTPP
ncbi:glycosyltransferase [Leucobacter coleopterorum]|uniref:glycosyltransferase n=1 Tax=Leucobacter coleopterorum TaxID=2714933 RepID=UPI00313790C1